LDRTSLEDLSAATGVSARMLIHYFGSKDGLLSAALNEARRQQLSAAHEHLARAAVADVHDLLVTMRSFLASPATERHLRLFTEVAAVSARDPRRFSGFSRASVHDWLPALEAPLRQAGHDAATATALATLALAVERGLLLDSNATGERARVEAAHEALLRLLRL
jgi:AcrR family transcriptional regulator